MGREGENDGQGGGGLRAGAEYKGQGSGRVVLKGKGQRVVKGLEGKGQRAGGNGNGIKYF